MLKKEYSTHENRHLFDLQSDIQNSILKNTSFYLYDIYVWNRTNSTKKIMFGSYPYPNNFYSRNIIEFISIYVKSGENQKRSKVLKEKSKLTKYEWVNFTKQIWDIPIPNKSDLTFGKHTAIMPEEIPYRLIKLFSFKDDIVLDPFAGSGTTLKVAKELSRNYIGYELYANYKNIIDKKIEYNNSTSKLKNKTIINKFIKKDIIAGLSCVDNNSIDLIIADPPYNLSIAEWDIFESEEEFISFSKKWIIKSIQKLKNGGSFYIFNTPKNCSLFLNIIEKEGLDFRNWITWYKKDGFSNSSKKYNNAQESIIFFTKGDQYTFNKDDIRIEYDSTERIKHAEINGILKKGKRWFPNLKGKLCTDVWEI